MIKQIATVTKGMAMGLAEIVPGVSGGTIAFITGIYEQLITSIRRIDKTFVSLIGNGKLKEALAYINAPFLILLVSGMVVGIVAGVFGITHLIDNYPIQVWAFFFSLIAASSFLVARDIKRFNWASIGFMVLGTLFALWVTSGQPVADRTSLGFVFISGVLAISALLLPGLSGSFVLLLLGMYSVVIPALRDLLSGNLDQLTIVVSFAAGCLVGVFTLSRLLHWGYMKYKDPVLAVLTGFMLGSLNKIWPWQKVILTKIDEKGREIVTYSQSVSPKAFAQLENNPVFGNDPVMLTSVIIMCITFIVVVSISFVSKKQ
jgi:putative membrane protein